MSRAERVARALYMLADIGALDPYEDEFGPIERSKHPRDPRLSHGIEAAEEE